MAADRDPAMAFYTVQHSETIGWTGGLMVLGRGGRPLEFHCTLPVRPSRTHEILFGPTLRSHLIGDRIAEVLLPRSRNAYEMLMCDQPEAMLIQQHHPSLLQACTIAFVAGAGSDDEDPIDGDMFDGLTSTSFRGTDFYHSANRQSNVDTAMQAFCDLPDL
ncbi:MAG: hypothetical protein AAFP69_09070, partial [Planctomycetota bacterium]